MGQKTSPLLLRLGLQRYAFWKSSFSSNNKNQYLRHLHNDFFNRNLFLLYYRAAELPKKYSFLLKKQCSMNIQSIFFQIKKIYFIRKRLCYLSISSLDISSGATAALRESRRYGQSQRAAVDANQPTNTAQINYISFKKNLTFLNTCSFGLIYSSTSAIPSFIFHKFLLLHIWKFFASYSNFWYKHLIYNTIIKFLSLPLYLFLDRSYGFSLYPFYPKPTLRFVPSYFLELPFISLRRESHNFLTLSSDRKNIHKNKPAKLPTILLNRSRFSSSLIMDLQSPSLKVLPKTPAIFRKKEEKVPTLTLPFDNSYKTPAALRAGAAKSIKYIFTNKNKTFSFPLMAKAKAMTGPDEMIARIHYSKTFNAYNFISNLSRFAISFLKRGSRSRNKSQLLKKVVRQVLSTQMLKGSTFTPLNPSSFKYNSRTPEYTRIGAKALLGIGFAFSGRVYGSKKASSFKIFRGSVPLNSFSSNIDFSSIMQNTRNGTWGFRLWLHLAEPQFGSCPLYSLIPKWRS